MQEPQHFTKALKHSIFKIISDVSNNLGMESYVIGGYVRDHLLNRGESKDIDIVTVGSGIQLAKEVSKCLPGRPKVSIFKNYGTAMIITDSIELEFVGARKESYRKESRNPAVEDGTLEDDQNRRDFTINALALSLQKDSYGALLDPFNGSEDLKDKVIRTPMDPDITYSDDPLRMLRAIRFSTQLHFEIETGSLEAIIRNADRINIISKERITDELHKILATNKPSIGLTLLDKTNLLPKILPELSALKGVEDFEGQRHKDNFWHTLEVVDNISKTTEDIWLRWAALLHDIGKEPTKKFDKKQGWTFHGHEFVGSKMVYKLFKRLKLPLNERMKFVQKMVLMSSRPIVIASDVTDSAVRRLIFDAGDHIDQLMTLCEADITTKNPNKQKRYLDNFKIVRNKIVEVEERDHIRNFQPPITGEMIMKTYGLKPSREIGVIKDAIKEAILEGTIKNDFKEAYQFMLKQGEQLGLKKID
jgi:tRNA nucleotidyltransferase (CCA-adding enzyme)